MPYLDVEFLFGWFFFVFLLCGFSCASVLNCVGPCLGSGKEKISSIFPVAHGAFQAACHLGALIVSPWPSAPHILPHLQRILGSGVL